jgi:hypothetical protein
MRQKRKSEEISSDDTKFILKENNDIESDSELDEPDTVNNTQALRELSRNLAMLEVEREKRAEELRKVEEEVGKMHCRLQDELISRNGNFSSLFSLTLYNDIGDEIWLLN